MESAYAVLIFLSKNGLDSEWVQKETVETSHRQTPRVVLLLEPCDVPQALQSDPIVNMSRVQGAAGLDQLRHYRRGLQSLIDQLDSFYPVRRHMQARELGELGDPRSSEALIQSLSDPDIDVRFAAAEAIGKLRSEPAQKSLIRLMETDEDPDVQAAAAGALGSIGLPGAIAPLIGQLDNPDRFVRQAAILALGHLHAGAAVPPLVHLMRNDPIFDVRQAAVQALCIIGGPIAERALRRTGVDCDPLEPN